MGKYIRATSKKSFLCAWKCCSCSHVNVEEPQAEMFAREDITLFQKEAVAREKALAAANKNLEELLDRIPTLVNEKLNFNQLDKCGTCSQCGTQQPWAKKPKYTVILAVIALVATIAAAIPLSEYIPFVVCGGLLLVMAAVALGEFLSVRSRRRAAQEIADEHCRPLAITKAIPDHVKRDDPRLTAIVAHIAAKRSA